MDLEFYFDPIPESLTETKFPLNSFFSHIHHYGETFPDLEGMQIAIIGLTDGRGIKDNRSIENAATEIRLKLYDLKRGLGHYKVADLGNLRNGVDLKETYLRIQTVGEQLMKMQILPIYIGGSHDLDFGQYLSYEGMKKLVSMLTVDAKIDMEDEGMPNEVHSQDIILHQPNFLFNYTQLAYQSFLTDRDLVNVMEKLYFDHVRLGQLRENFKEIEPLIRNADLLSFDISSIQSADAPGAADAQPFGLTAEEACQVCWFAGMNEKLSSIGIYGYQPYYDDTRYKTAAVIATMIWYFIEGFYHRKDSLSFQSNDYTKYTVSLDAKPSTFIFYKSNISGKWWMEVPHSGNQKYDRETIIPCSYQDYQIAQSGEIPERWINAQLKMY
ncbi:formimidoylglutamase [Litoribacter ruber]|uniref:Formimidoylglutamase n=1 Tax=Litoribacter ruber TaxID=702568 RepID=A0AAP2CIE5_9BACT|nr:MULTISPECIES: formimidoylglutamase [Litoribacter]MBS9522417.1 formimidoylglutamase [Litoribacter alkaliphilus]MBT0813005.1 formimidoylglutamase [Litoribacter ruber]